jgi:hypothetical protein
MSGYYTKNPLSWPTSRGYARFANTTHKELTVEKAVQKWVQFHSEKLYFPGVGTFSAGGVDKYISNIGELIPSDDGTIPPAIDTGCGVRDPANFCRFISSLLQMHVSTTIKRSRSKPVLTIRLGGVDSLLQVASWGAYLLERNVLTMSFAPRDTHPKCNLLWKEEFLQFSV